MEEEGGGRARGGKKEESASSPRRRLVQHDDLALSEQAPSEAEKLTLTLGKGFLVDDLGFQFFGLEERKGTSSWSALLRGKRKVRER